MGEEFTADCSWKKMVIAKANNEWISTIKSEMSKKMNISNFDLNDDVPLSTIKKESVEVNIDLNTREVAETMTQELDPILIERPPRLKRRKLSTSLKTESPDERAARLAKMSAYAAQRLANESSEQRAARLKRMSEYAARRLAQESSEQRAKRLARMSAYAAKRLAEETAEQRSARLARMSAYAARRQAMKKTTPTDSQNSSYDYESQMDNLMANQS